MPDTHTTDVEAGAGDAALLVDVDDRTVPEIEPGVVGGYGQPD